jgi:hypothetical protein
VRYLQLDPELRAVQAFALLVGLFVELFDGEYGILGDCVLDPVPIGIVSA